MKRILRYITMLTFVLTLLTPHTARAQNLPDEGQERVLQIVKTTDAEVGRIPLPNAVFDIYKTEGIIEPGETPTEEELARFVRRGNLAATILTDEQGAATLNFTKARLKDGVYLIVEQPNPAMEPEEPFYLSVPGNGEQGRGLYTQNILCESLLEKAPAIRMDVTKIGNDSDSFDLEEPQTWIIRSDIPSGIANAREYAVTDVLNYRLTYEPGSTLVKLYRRDDMEVTLQEKIHYILTEDTVLEHGYTVNCFQIALTGVGKTFVAANLGEGPNHPELRIYFRSAINTSTAMGSTIPNDAHLYYASSVGIDHSVDSDIPEIHTGGINLHNTNAQGNPLPGAAFMVAREATQAEMETESVLKEVLYVDGEDLAVVYVDFYTSADLQGKKQDVVTTDTRGNACVYGLAYGTYYLVEIQPPEGYNQPAEPIPIRINETSHLTAEDGWRNSDGEVVDNTRQIIHRKFVLPNTGGAGTAIFTVSGGGLLLFAWRMLRKKKQQV